MIPLSRDFDLGKDESRMKDRADAERQARTAEVLLSRFFSDDPEQRWELQLVADEVGMGKTFVALGLTYSLLAVMRQGLPHPDLRACAKRVLVIAPGPALAQKWVREVGEFVKRCVADEIVDETNEWFRPERAERADEVARFLRRKSGPAVVVTEMSTLAGSKKLKHYDLKRRLLLGVLFRYWGNRFNRDARERLLKGAPSGWPTRPDELTVAPREDWDRTPFENEEEMLDAVRAFADSAKGAAVEDLLNECKTIAEPFKRDRESLFREVESQLADLYRGVCFAGLRTPLPLVIVDEAHNWKNGPGQGTNGYRGFEALIAPLTRRALLLTATPFQLQPKEMLELLKVGSIIAPCGASEESDARRERMRTHREVVLGPVLETAARRSRAFAAAWARLPTSTAREIGTTWLLPKFRQVRNELRDVAHLPGRVDSRIVDRIVEGCVVGEHVDQRDLLREGLRLYAHNEDLSQELGAFVIRHRRRTDHRLFRVGAEYANDDGSALKRADRTVLHASPGIDVRGDAELPHYLLMRCVTDMKKGRGRSSLGTALTGCYSTLLQSAEGRSLREKLSGGAGSHYFDLLMEMVDEARDADHPKMRAVVEEAMRAWHVGEKMLIFCFRTHTARRLEAIIASGIERQLQTRRKSVLDGAKGLQRLRGRITRREGDLAPLALDRVLWSLRWASRANDAAFRGMEQDDLRLTDAELEDLARLGLRYGIDLLDDRLDRVFMHRAVEHLIAKRFVEQGARSNNLFGQCLHAISGEAWVQRPYGLPVEDLEPGESAARDGEDEAAEASGIDDRGVRTSYRVKLESPPGDRVTELAHALRERRERARRVKQVPLVDVYAEGPSFWLGDDPTAHFDGDAAAVPARALARIHDHLLALTRNRATLDWRQRLLVFEALRRAVLRESVLVRILPARADLEESGWGDLLVQRLFAPWDGQRESTADRLAVYLEDLRAAGGSVYAPGTSKHAMYEASRMRGTQFVVLVDGSTLPERRERVFAGFNSPLLPEIMICTSVGQEGIDLHRHCRRVVHYDLAWNPAVLEQRTGRVDRIGSKTFRERQEGGDAGNAYLDVGVPFLAGTYDERMYEEIRIRAQTFEVLTGGDVSADNLEGRDDDPEAAEGTEESLDYPVLPAEMINDLRVRLHVWEAAPGTRGVPDAS